MESLRELGLCSKYYSAQRGGESVCENLQLFTNPSFEFASKPDNTA